ncbi:hypothetical protein TNCV_1331751 [Trichonephila clavipes]|nr:hypothetical protein TNCV_1331751 [Trichonephila clavipes]
MFACCWCTSIPSMEKWDCPKSTTWQILCHIDDRVKRWPQKYFAANRHSTVEQLTTQMKQEATNDGSQTTI